MNLVSVAMSILMSMVAITILTLWTVWRKKNEEIQTQADRIAKLQSENALIDKKLIQSNRLAQYFCTRDVREIVSRIINERFDLMMVTNELHGATQTQIIHSHQKTSIVNILVWHTHPVREIPYIEYSIHGVSRAEDLEIVEFQSIMIAIEEEIKKSSKQNISAA